MNANYTINNGQYQAHVDRLNHLILVQEIVVDLKRDDVISERTFTEKWNHYEHAIRDIFKMLRSEGFIILFNAKGKSHLFIKIKELSSLID